MDNILTEVLAEDLKANPTSTNNVKPEPKTTPSSEEVSKESSGDITLNFLEEIFTEQALEAISVKDLDKSLSEIIKKLKGVSRPAYNLEWTFSEGQASVEFDRSWAWLSKNFLELGPEASVSPSRDSELFRISVTLLREDNEELEKQVRLIDDIAVRAEEKLSESELQPYKFSGTPDIVSTFERDKGFFLKVPIAKEGEFHHPAYGKLSFDQETVSTIKKNIEDNVLGYEIPITVGHTDEEEKDGSLVSIETEDTTLFGIWEVDKDVYRKVQDNKVNYSSAEFYPQYRDKKTGDQVGRTLFGMALTNRPFIPNLPKVQALGDKEGSETQWLLSEIAVKPSECSTIIEKSHQPEAEALSENTIGTNMSDNNQTPAPVKEAEAEVKDTVAVDSQKLSEEIQSLQEQYAQKLSEVEAKYKETLSEITEKNSLLSDRLQKYEERIKEEELNAKVNYLNELTLPEDFKKTYVELVKEGKLGESEEAVMQSLSELAKSFQNDILVQHGSSNATANLNDEKFKDPYEDVIAYNKKLAEAKRAKALGIPMESK